MTLDSVVKDKYVTEYIVAFCKPGQARIVVTEWVAGRKREVEAK